MEQEHDTTSPPLGKREQNKRETRRAIRDAALDLALEFGLEKLTVETIATRAGVSPRTFFNYFASKEDALVTQAAQGVNQVRELLQQRPPEESDVHALREAILSSEYFGTEPIDRTRTFSRHRLTQQHPTLMAHHLGKIAFVEQTFAQALAERRGKDVETDTYSQLLAAIALSVIRVAMRQWVKDGNAQLRQVLHDAFDQVENLGMTTTD